MSSGSAERARLIFRIWLGRRHRKWRQRWQADLREHALEKSCPIFGERPGMGRQKGRSLATALIW